MSPEKQRIAIAEACGWKLIQYDDITPPWFENKQRRRFGDPLSDLNAMHEAEKVLKDSLDRDIYVAKLAGLCWEKFDGEHDAFRFLTATAAQRAESFLKTLGLWVESDESLPPAPSTPTTLPSASSPVDSEVSRE